MKNKMTVDISKSDIFFVGDTHFSHANIIKYDGRPYASPHLHDEAIIKNWNRCIDKNDIVFHLGDVAFFKNPDQCENILKRLNGRIYLIEGNHDKELLKHSHLKAYFQMVTNYLKVTVKDEEYHDQDIILFHYPMEEWDGAFHGTWHLHGHVHGNLKTKIKNRLEVSINCINYKPINYDQIHDILNPKG